jgi:glycosyltransferase involved in cell wall biosynthesis
MGHLRAAGVQLALRPFFSKNYLERLYAGRSTFGPSLIAYVRRVVHLMFARKSVLIWLEKEALPWMPWSIERVFLPWRLPLVVDYDDAVFHRYDLHRSAIVRRLLGKKLDKLMASAVLVTAGNRYLADRAIAAGACRVEIVPTVVDLNAYVQRLMPTAAEALTIGWIGTPSTWNEYMKPMMPILTKEAAATGTRIVAVGAGRAAEAHPLLDSLQWTEDSEVSTIQTMSVGIMPLIDTPWARGKCGYKLIQYMACGIPVIASPVGVNSTIIEHGVNGFLATTEAEWVVALRTLLRDHDLRARMGREGRLKVERDYSLQVWGPRVAQILSHIATEDRRI